MKAILCAVSAGLLAMSATFAAAASGDIGGRYRVDGKNPNGSPYKGTAEIVVTTKNTCRIEWKTGGTTSEGICMRNENAFSAAYELQGNVGLVIYEIMEDGTMEGIWTVADQEGVGAERLVPMK